MGEISPAHGTNPLSGGKPWKGFKLHIMPIMKKATTRSDAKSINLATILIVGVTASIAAAAEEFETKTDIEFAVVDGVSLKLDAIMPKSRGPHPAIVYVHGGGFTGGD